MSEPASNPLREYFEANDGRVIHKWMHYFDIYHRHLQRFRGTAAERPGTRGLPRRLAPDVEVVLRARARRSSASTSTRTASSSRGTASTSRSAIRRTPDSSGPWSRPTGRSTWSSTTVPHHGPAVDEFAEIYPHTQGAFLVEDLHTSYWSEFGGGYRRSGTFVEQAKGLVDQWTAWHSRDAGIFQVDAFTRSTRGIHFYDSVVVFEREAREAPFHRMMPAEREPTRRSRRSPARGLAAAPAVGTRAEAWGAGSLPAPCLGKCPSSQFARCALWSSRSVSSRRPGRTSARSKPRASEEGAGSDPRVARVGEGHGEDPGAGVRAHGPRCGSSATEAFRKQVTSDRDNLTKRDEREIKTVTETLRAFGLLGRGGVDLFDAVNRAKGANVLAYYSPEDEEIVVRGTGALRSHDPHQTLAHELTHVLQDQHFDLPKIEEADDRGSTPTRARSRR